jgi:glycosyltransferase involved in cell wall biosynthesis
MRADRELRFSVVIPTMNRTAMLRETLQSLHECEPPPAEVIVVDADSGASARDVVAEFQDDRAPAVRYLNTEPSLTAQRNRGIDEAGGDVIVFLDDDVDLPASLFAQLAHAYADPALVGATGHIVERQPRRLGGPTSPIRALLHRGREGTFTRFGYPRYIRHVDRDHDVEYMLGCFMSARREPAAEVRFDELLTGYALAEDEDFSYRLSRRGRIRYLPGIVVHHKKLGFASKDSREFGRLVIANRAYLFRKNFPQTRIARAQFAMLVGVLVAHRIVNLEWRGALGLIEGALRLRRGGSWARSA